MQHQFPTYRDINKAYKRIYRYVNNTPVLTSSFFNSLFNAKLFFKCENFQKTGSFKFRGAINTVLTLSDSEISRGLATHSSGNHAQALALAANIMKTKAYIVMPENSPSVKKNAVNDYGAEIYFCKSTLKAREHTLNNIIKKTNAVFIHPYDDVRIIAGQGTVAKELLEEVPDIDIVICPVGGGGLLSGTSITTKVVSKAKVIAAEPKGANDAYRSFKAGKLFPSINPNTLADGLLTSLSQLTFSIISKNVDDIITAKEETITESMKLIWERMKIIVEPSSAVVIAAMIENKEIFKNKKIGVVLSGGNVNLDSLPF